MIRGLLIEDDDQKRKDIESHLSATLEITIDQACSFQAAKRALLLGRYDLIILDMTLPSFDVSPIESGGSTKQLGGKLIMRFLHREEIKCPVIILTRFDTFPAYDNNISLKELARVFSVEYSGFFIDAIYYNSSSSEWKAHLTKAISNALKGNSHV